jgi:peptide/nickel transport system substrate-binding protein
MLGGYIMATTIAMVLLALTVTLVIACGGAPAAPDPMATSPAEAASDAAPTATVASDTAQPTPTPQVAVPPAEVEVNPGKVTWMIGSFGNERFDYTFNTAGHDYARQIHGFLISSDVEEGRRILVPGIATDWDFSPDGLTWTLTIREGGKFHDGTDVTAEDVSWSLQHCMGPQAKEYAMGGDCVTMSQIMDRIEQTGPNQISVTAQIPVAEFPQMISEATGSWAGVVYPKRGTLHNEEEELDYDKNPIGAGLLKLVGHIPAQVMNFERFNHYYYQPENGFPIDKRVNFQFMDLYLVPEEATRVAAMRAGDADIAPVSLALRSQVEAGGGRLVFAQEGSYFRVRMYGCWNLPELTRPCDDKPVRQALGYALDKELMRDKLYGGPEVMQVKGWTAVTPSTVGYSPELDPFPFDPNKARQLMADAGYPNGEGFGKLVINTWPSTTSPLMVESAQLAAEMWKRELGLDTEVRVGDEAALKEASSLTKDLHGQILWRDNETRIDAADTIRSGYGSPEEIDKVHNDPEVVDLVKQATAVFDPEEREVALNRAFQRLREEGYDINVGYLNIPFAVGPRIQTWEPYPLAFYPSALHTITLK